MYSEGMLTPIMKITSYKQDSTTTHLHMSNALKNKRWDST